MNKRKQSILMVFALSLSKLTNRGVALELTGKGTKYYKDDDLN
jgi:hypothetical protein